MLEVGGDGELEVIATASGPTEADAGPPRVLARLAEIGHDALGRWGPVERAGVGVPGLFDQVSGTIELFPNLPGPWRGQPMLELADRGVGRSGLHHQRRPRLHLGRDPPRRRPLGARPWSASCSAPAWAAGWWSMDASASVPTAARARSVTRWWRPMVRDVVVAIGAASRPSPAPAPSPSSEVGPRPRRCSRRRRRATNGPRRPSRHRGPPRTRHRQHGHGADARAGGDRRRHRRRRRPAPGADPSGRPPPRLLVPTDWYQIVPAALGPFAGAIGAALWGREAQG